jgi:hypothetical protein
MACSIYGHHIAFIYDLLNFFRVVYVSIFQNIFRYIWSNSKNLFLHNYSVSFLFGPFNSTLFIVSGMEIAFFMSEVFTLLPGKFLRLGGSTQRRVNLILFSILFRLINISPAYRVRYLFRFLLYQISTNSFPTDGKFFPFIGTR